MNGAASLSSVSAVNKKAAPISAIATKTAKLILRFVALRMFRVLCILTYTRAYFLDK